MSEDKSNGSENNAAPAPVYRVVMQILECGFEYCENPTPGEFIVNSQWMYPKWDCDSLQHIADAMEEKILEVTSVLELLDSLAEQWGDEAVFRRCRDRLRAVIRE